MAPARKNYRIAVIPGDGIGKETVPEGLRVLDAASEDGVTYVVNEWGNGASLDRLLAEE